MGRLERKMGQIYRREARKVYAGYSKSLYEKLDMFNEALKPKPRLIPHFIWRWFVSFVVDIPKLENVLNPKSQKTTGTAQTSKNLKRCPNCQKWIGLDCKC